MLKPLIIVLSTVSLIKAISNINETSRIEQEMTTPVIKGVGNAAPFFYLDNVMQECNKTFMIDPSYMKALQESGSFPDETDKTPKCYVRCMLEMSGVSDIDDDNKYDTSQASILFGGEMTGDVEAIAKTCNEQAVDSCKCERAYHFVKCIREMEIEMETEK